MKHSRPFLVLAPLLLAGCAASSYCEGDQDYADAASVPVIQPADGLQIKESNTALKIPPPPETKVPYGEKVVNEKGKEVFSCLDQPPPLVLPEPKPAADAPVPMEAPVKPAEPAKPEAPAK